MEDSGLARDLAESRAGQTAAPSPVAVRAGTLRYRLTTIAGATMMTISIATASFVIAGEPPGLTTDTSYYSFTLGGIGALSGGVLMAFGISRL